MTATAHLLASGPGWRVSDIVCTAGPDDRAFEEAHPQHCIAIVRSGSFRYRSTQGSAVLAPGSLLLGNRGACFECGHEHAAGDRCLAFQFEPAWLEGIVAAVPGARQIGFAQAHLSALAPLAGVVAEAEIAADEPERLEETALRLAGAVASVLSGAKPGIATPSARDQRRITRALRHIEAHSEDALSIDELAWQAAMSPYHFLRTFRALVGMTPHQYVLRTRLHRAALLLRRTDQPIAGIAFDCGFGDLSTFNRRFKRVMSAKPSDYRGA
ncbi:AraC-like DNA-binding protein [Bosea sp. 62]|uniref:helix-turn-helix transcriptional regulator n=1 Tax=unclassified Bosea (in: a-proteobacteria) TaxID=2653178 RepID=UPI0012525757|nr:MULTISPECIES: AraC family transcriptional regulator [unclassified Bosea (in: a-proteobacteria)]CAD5291123.1 AraC-like DNA-binding protein [Bosea sp. 7B]CAD5299833.1 AraC-like DNA-binding protein [Bosea sp. 21B]CAD5300458.1 AraC-like DNA-binding protein [Bosea sp. 46]VVT61774.1 AraC-type DNA-binding protein [Bosea sp. EC-HK365B]VXB03055.1 AraC-like DNA-binding protein [Bosea sp. 127]